MLNYGTFDQTYEKLEVRGQVDHVKWPSKEQRQKQYCNDEY